MNLSKMILKLCIILFGFTVFSSASADIINKSSHVVLVLPENFSHSIELEPCSKWENGHEGFAIPTVFGGVYKTKNFVDVSIVISESSFTLQNQARGVEIICTTLSSETLGSFFQSKFFSDLIGELKKTGTSEAGGYYTKEPPTGGNWLDLWNRSKKKDTYKKREQKILQKIIDGKDDKKIPCLTKVAGLYLSGKNNIYPENEYKIYWDSCPLIGTKYAKGYVLKIFENYAIEGFPQHRLTKQVQLDDQNSIGLSEITSDYLENFQVKRHYSFRVGTYNAKGVVNDSSFSNEIVIYLAEPVKELKEDDNTITWDNHANIDKNVGGYTLLIGEEHNKYAYSINLKDSNTYDLRKLKNYEFIKSNTEYYLKIGTFSNIGHNIDYGKKAIQFKFDETLCPPTGLPCPPTGLKIVSR